jgi:hypothetical protein
MLSDTLSALFGILARRRRLRLHQHRGYIVTDSGDGEGSAFKLTGASSGEAIA